MIPSGLKRVLSVAHTAEIRRETTCWLLTASRRALGTEPETHWQPLSLLSHKVTQFTDLSSYYGADLEAAVRCRDPAVFKKTKKKNQFSGLQGLSTKHTNAQFKGRNSK